MDSYIDCLQKTADFNMDLVLYNCYGFRGPT